MNQKQKNLLKVVKTNMNILRPKPISLEGYTHNNTNLVSMYEANNNISEDMETDNLSSLESSVTSIINNESYIFDHKSKYLLKLLDTPIHLCICCHRLWFKKQITRVTKKLSRILLPYLLNVVSSIEQSDVDLLLVEVVI